MEDPSSRTAQGVLDDHLNVAEPFGGEGDVERLVEEDLHRNDSEEVVVLTNRGTFRGHEGVRRLARMLISRDSPSSVATSTPTRPSRGRWRS